MALPAATIPRDLTDEQSEGTRHKVKSMPNNEMEPTADRHPVKDPRNLRAAAHREREASPVASPPWTARTTPVASPGADHAREKTNRRSSPESASDARSHTHSACGDSPRLLSHHPQRDLNVIIARGIAATRDAAGLPLKRAGSAVAEIGPEHPVGRHAVGQHTSVLLVRTGEKMAAFRIPRHLETAVNPVQFRAGGVVSMTQMSPSSSCQG